MDTGCASLSAAFVRGAACGPTRAVAALWASLTLALTQASTHLVYVLGVKADHVLDTRERR